MSVRRWAIMLGGLAIWAAHFLLLYGLASVFPGRAEAKTLIVVATIPALAGAAVLLWMALARAGRADPVDRWMFRLAALAAAVAIVAMVWQAAPVLFA